MAMVTDPVCGMQIEESEAAAQLVYEGQPLFFCSEDCRRTFENAPEEFVDGQQAGSRSGSRSGAVVAAPPGTGLGAGDDPDGDDDGVEREGA